MKKLFTDRASFSSLVIVAIVTKQNHVYAGSNKLQRFMHVLEMVAAFIYGGPWIHMSEGCASGFWTLLCILSSWKSQVKGTLSPLKLIYFSNKMRNYSKIGMK